MGTNQGVIDWPHYLNRGEATYYLTRFTDTALSPDIGIIWYSNDCGTLIRKPKLHAEAYGGTDSKVHLPHARRERIWDISSPAMVEG